MSMKLLLAIGKLVPSEGRTLEKLIKDACQEGHPIWGFLTSIGVWNWDPKESVSSKE